MLKTDHSILGIALSFCPEVLLRWRVWSDWKSPVLSLVKLQLMTLSYFFRSFPRGTVVKNLPDNAGDAREVGSTSGSGSNWPSVSLRASCFTPAEQKRTVSDHRPDNLPFLAEAFLKTSAFKSALRKADRRQNRHPTVFRRWPEALCPRRGSRLMRPSTFQLLGLILLNHWRLSAFSLWTVLFSTMFLIV